MEIERINENTIKFYMSYMDIEERGFARDEIWHNRERSEQLFWKMMEEVNHKEDFVVEGPLWIQVHALEKGLEVVVTKSQLPRKDEDYQLSFDAENDVDIPIDEKIESLLGSNLESEDNQTHTEDKAIEKGPFSVVVRFKEFEDVIQLSHSFDSSIESISEKLYYYDDAYFLFMEFAEEFFNKDLQEDILSRVLEFSTVSDMSTHILDVYGKVVFSEDVIKQVKDYFKK